MRYLLYRLYVKLNSSCVTLLFEQSEDLFSLVEAHDGKELKLYVYNTDADTGREVVITPNSDWGGEGRYGNDSFLSRKHCIGEYSTMKLWSSIVGPSLCLTRVFLWESLECKVTIHIIFKPFSEIFWTFPPHSIDVLSSLQSRMWDWLWLPTQDTYTAVFRGQEDQFPWTDSWWTSSST